MRSVSRFLIGLVLVTPSLAFGQSDPASQPAGDGLADVVGIEGFVGSGAARQMLETNGFVVTDRQFKQIFSAYVNQGLPKFITTDSAWHTYHVLLEEGVRQLEYAQAVRMESLSRCVLGELRKRAADEPGWGELADFVAVGLAIQDLSAGVDPNRRDLAETVQAIRAGREVVRFPIGLPLSGERFRPVSFYTKSPSLSAFFAARQWYGSVDFRLSSAEETAMAVKLSLLIESNTKLRGEYERLTNVYATMLGRPEDGDVSLYASAARKALGDNASPTAVDKGVEAIRKEIASRLPDPLVNDQLLTPTQYARFAEVTKGFRLFPSRLLASEACFQNTVPPKIKGRVFPSGLDFFVASKKLRSPAAERALETQEGRAIAAGVAAAECPKLGNSLHGQAMKLLAELQKPVPARAPRAMKTEAWSDKQLCTQLSAWAEQRHTWAAHTKTMFFAMCLVDEHPGIVSPYPDFFAGLGRLSTATADAFVAADGVEQMDARAVAAMVLDYSAAWDKVRELYRNKPPDVEKIQFPEGLEAKSNEFHRRVVESMVALSKRAGKRIGWTKTSEDMVAAARSVLAGEALTQRDRTLLWLFVNRTDEVTTLLRSFGEVCDTLAAISRKQIAGQALSDADKDFIRNYAECLGKHQLYCGDSYLDPRDDLPMITPVFVNPAEGRTLYVGVARPLALYVIAEVDGNQILHLGGVLNYREFHHPSGDVLTDEAWIERIKAGKAAPAPRLAASFTRAVTPDEIVTMLRAGRIYADIDAYDDRKITLALLQALEKGGIDDDWKIRRLVEHLAPRCTDADVPRLLKLATGEQADDFQDLGACIARLDWRVCRDDLWKLLDSDEKDRAELAATAFAWRPEFVDFARLAAKFDEADRYHRRLYCYVMGEQKKPDPSVKRALLRALAAKDAGLRWQAADALIDAGWGDAEIFSALAANLADKNEFVAARAAEALVAVKASDAGRLMLDCLAKLTDPNDDDDRDRLAEMQRGISCSAALSKILDSYPLSEPSRLASVLIEGLGELQYKPATAELTRWLEGSLCEEAIKSLGQVDPAGQVGRLMKMLPTPHGQDAVLALRFMSLPDWCGTMEAIAKDAKAHPLARGAAISSMGDYRDSAAASRLADLLNDETLVRVDKVVTYSSESTFDGGQAETKEIRWRICDLAAAAIARLLSWEECGPYGPKTPAERAAVLARARKWAASLQAPAGKETAGKSPTTAPASATK